MDGPLITRGAVRVWVGVSSSPRTRKASMHYRNGREAHNGDRIIQLDYDTGKVVAVGVLHSAVPGNNFCNGIIAPIQSITQGACLCDCIHADDLAAMLKEKGLDKRPAGK